MRAAVASRGWWRRRRSEDLKGEGRNHSLKTPPEPCLLGEALVKRCMCECCVILRKPVAHSEEQVYAGGLCPRMRAGGGGAACVMMRRGSLNTTTVTLPAPAGVRRGEGAEPDCHRLRHPDKWFEDASEWVQGGRD